MKSRVWSLIVVWAVYVLAFVVAYCTVFLLKGVVSSALINLLVADVVATMVVYLFSVGFKNASLYDPYWSVQSFMLIVIYYLVYDLAFDARHLLILLPLFAWAARLTTNWAIGFESLEWMDWRYKMYKAKYPKIYQLIVLGGIMMMPTLLVFFGTVPLLLVVGKGYVNIWFLMAGGAVVLAATVLEAMADYQMKKFLKVRIKGQIIDRGLWKYSRHPNYFAEICVWWGVALACMPVAGVFVAGAACITLLFVFVSIPMMEKHIIEKAPQYEAYRESVSMLVPWKRRIRK